MRFILEEYREQANCERFVLPKTEEIKFFSEKIKYTDLNINFYLTFIINVK